MRRRALLSGALGVGLTLPLVACTGRDRPRGATVDASAGEADPEEVVMPERIAYGDDPSQFGTLFRPDGPARGTVVVLHGGFWKAAYGAELGEPLALRLADRGWAAWNLEYRRVGNGGGVPATLDDVHAGIERLAALDVDLGRVVTLGHSAGGQLAAWAAARGRFDRWAGPRVAVTDVISQAGVLDLAAADRAALGAGAVAAFVGGTVDDPAYARAYREADPSQQLPLDVPVRCVHARDDATVPLSQSESYVARATAAGAVAELIEVEGGHYGVIDVTSPAWARIELLVDEL